MNFLFDDEVKDTNFKEIWKNYSVALSELKAGDSAIIRMKELAENAMYQGVSRTERISVMDSGDYTDDSSVKHHLRIDGNDINSYIQMSRLLSKTDSATKGSVLFHFQIHQDVSYNIFLSALLFCIFS